MSDWPLNDWPRPAYLGTPLPEPKRKGPQVVAVRTLYSEPPATGQDKTRKVRRLFRRKPFCFYCGEQFPPEKLTRDHFIAKSKGGKSIGNIVPACSRCNTAKGDRAPTLAEIERFHKEGFAPKH